MNKFISVQITKISFLLVVNKKGRKPGEWCFSEFHLQWSGAPKLGFITAGELLSPGMSSFPGGMSDFNNALRGLSCIHEPLRISRVGASLPLTEPDEGIRASRAAVTSAAAIVKVGGCSQSKYLHPDENTFLDLWSYAEPHKCFSFKDSGALVCTAIDFWI